MASRIHGDESLKKAMMQNPGGAERENAAGQRRGRGRARWQRETIRQRGTNLVCKRTLEGGRKGNNRSKKIS